MSNDKLNLKFLNSSFGTFDQSNWRLNFQKFEMWNDFYQKQLILDLALGFV